MADVAGEAGLSQGIVNLHCQSKDNLLKETMQFIAQEYADLFRSALNESGPGPADKLLALVKADFKPAVCDRQKLAVWFAFWGEAKAIPTYQRIAANLDISYTAEMLELCEQLIEEGGYTDVDAKDVSNVLSALADGLWLSRHINPKGWSRADAMSAVMSYLKAVFPKHFSDAR